MRKECTASDFACTPILNRIDKYHTHINVKDEIQEELERGQKLGPAAPMWKKIHYQYIPCSVKSCDREVMAIGHILCHAHLKDYVDQMVERQQAVDLGDDSMPDNPTPCGDCYKDHEGWACPNM